MIEKDIRSLEAETIDLKKILLKYMRHWYLFIGALFLCLGGAFLFLLYSTPMYLVTSTLLIKDDKKKDAPISTDFGDIEMTNYSQNLDNEIEVLKSRGIMQRVMEELAMETTYFVEGQFVNEEIYGEHLPIRVIVNQLNPSAFEKTITIRVQDGNSFELENDQNVTSHKFGQKIEATYGTFTVVAAPDSLLDDHKKIIVQFNDVKQLGIDYNNKLEVFPTNENASVVMLRLYDAVPEKGLDIMSTLIELYNDEAISEKKAIAANNLQFLDGRLKYLIGELTDVEENVENYKRQYEVTDVSSEARLYLEKSTDYNKQLSDWNVQIDVLETIESYLTNNENKYELVPSSLNIQDPTLLVLIKKFNELQLERQNFLRTMQASHPLVENTNEQLANLQVNIVENLRNIKRGLIITRDNLQRSYAQVESKKQQVPSIERELLQINRQQGTKEGLYLYLLQKREESAMSLAANIQNAKVLDEAMVDEEPALPRRQLIFVLAFLLGIGLPIATIHIKDLMNDKIQLKTDVENLTETPILGEISHNSKREAIVVTKKNRSPVAELFWLIRANLQFATVGSENKVILVTSSMSGEGKTFFCINLGASLVLTGKRVVLLSFDLRKPSLMKSLGLPNDKGVTNYLISENSSIDEIIVPSQDMPDLYMIGSGPIPPNPSQIMLHPRVGTLIDELKEVFDYVIIDTAPVGQVADALALAPYIDSSIYVVRYNKTAKDQVKIIDDIYRNRKLKHPMIVLNDAKKQNGYGYGYGYGYGDQGHETGWNDKIKNEVAV
ncbi:GumC family protein [Pontibacter pamirensis]|uniref:GumC family protein n=1 Tax=Pontibacter pamirensis TaxID=2562824 RepID=UPI001389FF14|nr:polysaccharide biosynthesis tyrosine autokinase [Pontibacter pamirensis]